MEPIILNYPQFEQITRRIAVAFECQMFRACWEDWTHIGFFASKNELLMGLELSHEGELSCIWLGDEDQKEKSELFFDTSEYRDEKHWQYSPEPKYDGQMARGIYRLGIEDEDVWRELGLTLTVHEKLELRLSMPREFWPPKWFEEETEQIIPPH